MGLQRLKDTSSTMTEKIPNGKNSTAKSLPKTSTGSSSSSGSTASSNTSASSLKTKNDIPSNDISVNNGIIEPHFIGPPCGHHGNYTFYKAFRYSDPAGNVKILPLGAFFFVKISPEDDPCIGELQLLWEDKANKQILSSTRLYFLPEQTPEGRLSTHGEHEVLAASEKVILLLRDLVSWITDEVDWVTGLQLPLSKGLATNHHARPTPIPPALKDSGESSNPSQTSTSSVVIVSYPKYCRLRALMKQIEGRESIFMKHIEVIQKLCDLGIASSLTRFNSHFLMQPRTDTESNVSSELQVRVLFCRDTFEHEALLNHDLNCDHLAPKLKGRPRKRGSASKGQGLKSKNSNASQNKATVKKTPSEDSSSSASKRQTRSSSPDSGESSDQSAGESKSWPFRQTARRAAASSSTSTSSSSPTNKPHPKSTTKLRGSSTAASKTTAKSSKSSASAVDNRNDKNSEDRTALREICLKNECDFLENLHNFMNERKTPISRVPHLGFKQIDLFDFWRSAQKYGGYNQVTVNRKWKRVYDELGGDPNSTSAATCTRRHYERLLLPFEKYLGIGAGNERNTKEKKGKKAKVIHAVGAVKGRRGRKPSASNIENTTKETTKGRKKKSTEKASSECETEKASNKSALKDQQQPQQQEQSNDSQPKLVMKLAKIANGEEQQWRAEQDSSSPASSRRSSSSSDTSAKKRQKQCDKHEKDSESKIDDKLKIDDKTEDANTNDDLAIEERKETNKSAEAEVKVETKSKEIRPMKEDTNKLLDKEEEGEKTKEGIIKSECVKEQSQISKDDTLSNMQLSPVSDVSGADDSDKIPEVNQSFDKIKPDRASPQSQDKASNNELDVASLPKLTSAKPIPTTVSPVPPVSLPFPVASNPLFSISTLVNSMKTSPETSTVISEKGIQNSDSQELSKLAPPPSLNIEIPKPAHIANPSVVNGLSSFKAPAAHRSSVIRPAVTAQVENLQYYDAPQSIFPASQKRKSSLTNSPSTNQSPPMAHSHSNSMKQSQPVLGQKRKSDCPLDAPKPVPSPPKKISPKEDVLDLSVKKRCSEADSRTSPSQLITAAKNDENLLDLSLVRLPSGLLNQSVISPIAKLSSACKPPPTTAVIKPIMTSHSPDSKSTGHYDATINKLSPKPSIPPEPMKRYALNEHSQGSLKSLPNMVYPILPPPAPTPPAKDDLRKEHRDRESDRSIIHKHGQKSMVPPQPTKSRMDYVSPTHRPQRQEPDSLHHRSNSLPRIIDPKSLQQSRHSEAPSNPLHMAVGRPKHEIHNRSSSTTNEVSYESSRCKPYTKPSEPQAPAHPPKIPAMSHQPSRPMISDYNPSLPVFPLPPPGVSHAPPTSASGLSPLSSIGMPSNYVPSSMSYFGPSPMAHGIPHPSASMNSFSSPQAAGFLSSLPMMTQHGAFHGAGPSPADMAILHQYEMERAIAFNHMLERQKANYFAHLY